MALSAALLFETTRPANRFRLPGRIWLFTGFQPFRGLRGLQCTNHHYHHHHRDF